MSLHYGNIITVFYDVITNIYIRVSLCYGSKIPLHYANTIMLSNYGILM